MAAKIRPPKAWTPPPRALLIAASARSGSTLLAHLVRSINVMGRPDEYFNRSWLQTVRGGPLPSAEECFRYAFENGRSPEGTLGIKFIAGQLHYVDSRCALEEWLPNRSWIVLRRRDVLGQAISQAIAEQTGVWSSFQKAEVQPAYDRKSILRSLALALEENAYLSLYFALHSEQVLELTYEDFERDHQKAIDAICRRFGVEPQDENFSAPLRIVKQRTILNEAWRERFISETAARSSHRQLEIDMTIDPSSPREGSGSIDVQPPSLRQRLVSFLLSLVKR